MDIQPDFSSFYKRLSIAELLDILENPGSYQAVAIEAAKKEFSNRQLSEKELAILKNDQLENQLLMEEKEQKKKAFQDKMEYNGNSIIASINPDQEGISKNERSIRIVVVGLSAICFYQVIREIPTIQIFIKDFADMPIVAFYLTLELIVLPLALFLFWKRRPTGWRLLTIWLTYFVVEKTTMFLSSFTLGLFSYMIQLNSTPGFIIHLIILCGALYIICRKDIREEFKIEKNDIVSIIIITTLLTWMFLWIVS